ncbi:universal stress protein [Ramlibacter sp. USB13]|uniref:Universal stress protein n=1 Tax=Ramlibacter cellulosilyticus TaxID=2764187 RepID=A0A923MR82_9BURK|nr:universal stress protein [Ramlibacter cellulosilyticus]MBC5783486.1 universal stress protein [Ramlibacter cellulosilyticus]
MYKRILVPVDGSETSNKALVAGLQMARESGGRVRLVHVLDPMAFISTGYGPVVDLLEVGKRGAAQVLADALEMAKAAGVPADTKLMDSPGARLGEDIADEARSWEADLVVVGTHGRRGVSRALLGSGAEQVLRLSPVPVLAVRASEPPAR